MVKSDCGYGEEKDELSVCDGTKRSLSLVFVNYWLNLPLLAFGLWLTWSQYLCYDGSHVNIALSVSHPCLVLQFKSTMKLTGYKPKDPGIASSTAARDRFRNYSYRSVLDAT